MNIMVRNIVFGIGMLFFMAGFAFSQDTTDMNEDDFFGSSDVEAVDGSADVANIDEEIDKEMVGLSGNLEATSNYTMVRDFFSGNAGWDANLFANMIVGDFLVDIRLKKNFRAFLDINIGYLTNGTMLQHNFIDPAVPLVPIIYFEETSTLLGIKEAFIDFNIANVVYFRAGKQVLQWGLGYLWNPTDLINVERKSFVNMDALRQGVFGLRTDIVFAREFHLYTFVDFNSVEKFEDIAFSARAEFLAGTVEFGVSSWLKYNKIPVFGADISLPLFLDISMTAEGAFSWGDNQDKMTTGGIPYQVRDELVSKVAVGLSRSFDFMDVDDRIMVNAEFYYNYSGYDDNMFEALSAPILSSFYGNYYKSGNYGKYYGALFVTIKEFGRKEMTLTLSGMGNFSDLSFITMASLSIVPVNNFTLTAALTGYLGPDDREFSIAAIDAATGAITNNMLSVSIGAKVVF